ncbi:MAG: hypothetical protein WCP35_20285, partial [Verrucomicrobiota bacterium]
MGGSDGVGTHDLSRSHRVFGSRGGMDAIFQLTIRQKRILARILPNSKGHILHRNDFLITNKNMITEEVVLNAITHYAGTGEIQDVLVPYFRQTGRWVGDCRHWTKSTYRLASSIMHGAV